MKRVLVGGCFNRIHPGHIYFLKEAKKLGNHLSVILTHDENNKKEYAIDFKTRKRNLEKLNIADKIVEGDRIDFMKTVNSLRPDIVVLGYDQKMPIEVTFNKEVVRIKKHKHYSTKRMIKKKVTKTDLGRHCLVRNVSLVKTSNPPFDAYIWTIMDFRTIKKEQYVDLVCLWTNDNIWRVKVKDIELHETN